MRPDVHAAALRSAAKLVLGMASFAAVTTGCSSEATDDTGISDDAVTTKGPMTIDEIDPKGEVPEETSKACQATLASAFPAPGDYHWLPVPVESDVAACCDEELSKHGSMTPYRWDCCAAYDETATLQTDEDGNVIPWSAPTGMQKHGWACTPWGPPVPPQMRRSKKMSPRRHDMNRFLAAQVA